MMKTMRAALALLALVAGATAASAEDFGSLTDRWNALIHKNVRKSGGVNYIGMDLDRVELEAFLTGHADLDVQRMDDKARKAAYINLYNAAMVWNLLRYAREEKIDIKTKLFTDLKINDLKVPGGNIWNASYKVKLAGHEVTLDDIEHGLLRGEAQGALAPLKVSKLDPRIHTAVNCAALSCPRVREVAYRAENVEQMLEENMKEFLSSERQFSKVSDGKMQANSIVYWYYADFDDHARDVLKLRGAGDWLATYVEPSAKDRDWKIQHLKNDFNGRGKISLKLSTAFTFDYDWRVNDVRNK
jgi:hypothetical protein